mmetsp:Transcript_23909/g.44688  ORF Transcript_23909/g.44688 Transcript_23909/m.44688 type:complete len:221 (-) Transcript_23909:1425-2087(-)
MPPYRRRQQEIAYATKLALMQSQPFGLPCGLAFGLWIAYTSYTVSPAKNVGAVIVQGICRHLLMSPRSPEPIPHTCGEDNGNYDQEDDHSNQPGRDTTVAIVVTISTVVLHFGVGNTIKRYDGGPENYCWGFAEIGHELFLTDGFYFDIKEEDKAPTRGSDLDSGFGNLSSICKCSSNICRHSRGQGRATVDTVEQQLPSHRCSLRGVVIYGIRDEVHST